MIILRNPRPDELTAKPRIQIKLQDFQNPAQFSPQYILKSQEVDLDKEIFVTEEFGPLQNASILQKRKHDSILMIWRRCLDHLASRIAARVLDMRFSCVA